MAFRLSDLWMLDGRTGRGEYAIIGCVGVAIKHNLDRLLATFLFHRQWSVFNYWIPPSQALGIRNLSVEDAKFLGTMVCLALPFIWVGIALTVKRLRDAGLPPLLLIAFFLPLVNLGFFVLLCLIPSRERTAATAHGYGGWRAWLDWLLPRSPLGSAAAAAILTSVFGLLVTLLGASLLAEYGWGLFVALPFCLGLSAALLHGHARPRSLGSCLAVTVLALGLLAATLLAVAVEGAFCIAMAAPLALVLSLMGATIGYFLQRRFPTTARPALMSLLFLLAPAIIASEHCRVNPPALFATTTAIRVHAPPEVVWEHVIAFSDIRETPDWIFRHGIAYPMRARIDGTGVGAVRHCVFSTGEFVEPIQVWNAARRLGFSVVHNPPPMREWSPYRDLQTPHLAGFLVSEQGEFRLTPLEGGETLLEGTTWYRDSLWPAAYWRLWSDAIIHRIHLRVLRHIASEAEGAIARAQCAPPDALARCSRVSATPP